MGEGEGVGEGEGEGEGVDVCACFKQGLSLARRFWQALVRVRVWVWL